MPFKFIVKIEGRLILFEAAGKPGIAHQIYNFRSCSRTTMATQREPFYEARPLALPDFTRKQWHGTMDESDAAALVAEANNTVRHLVAARRFDRAIDILLRLVSIREYLGGVGGSDTVTYFPQLGWLFWRVGKLAEARYYTKRAYEDRVRVFGERHDDTLLSLEFLAAMANQAGDRRDALVLYERLLAAKSARHGTMASTTLRTLHNIGYLRRCQSDFPGAHASYLLALIGREKLLGRIHRDTLQTAINLAVLYKVHGRFEDEKAVYLRFLFPRPEPSDKLEPIQRKLLNAMRKRLFELQVS
jgi:hypothetical protein